MDPLHITLRRIQRRLTMQRWLDYTIDALFAGTLVACVYLVVARAFPLLAEPAVVAASVVGALLAAATVYALMRRPSLEEAATAADMRLGLRERFSSSLALAEAHGPMHDAVHRDARSHALGLQRFSERQAEQEDLRQNRREQAAQDEIGRQMHQREAG